MLKLYTQNEQGIGIVSFFMGATTQRNMIKDIPQYGASDSCSLTHLLKLSQSARIN